MKKIPVAKPLLGESEVEAAANVIRSGWVTQGPVVAEFEKKFAETVGAEHAVAVSSCTTGLHLSLLLHQVGPGDEVICPSMSFIATANCIHYTGAKVVFAEVGADFNLDLEDVKKRLTDRTRGIILVHQVGMPANLEAFRSFCQQNQLFLIEDSACAIGSKFHEESIGQKSELSCFSFHPRKVITTGEGGMMTTSRQDFADRLRLLRHHGMSVSDLARHKSTKVVQESYDLIGYNYRMTDIQAAIGIEQLQRLPQIIEQRRQIAHRYFEALAGQKYLKLPIETSGLISNFQSFMVTLTADCPMSATEFIDALGTKGVTCRPSVMLAHRQPAYSNNESRPLPFSEDLASRNAILPLFTQMTDEEIERVIAAVTETLNSID